jgi:hypothetical protein
MCGMQDQDLREHLDRWVAARAAYDALDALMCLEERGAYGLALEQIFAAELDAAEVLARAGFSVQTRGAEDPSAGLGLGAQPS